MYPVSANFHTLAIQDAPKTRVRIYFIGDAVDCTDDNAVQTNGTLLIGKTGDTDSNGRIGQNGITFSEFFNPDKNIQVGAAVSSQIGMTLLNTDGALDNFQYGRCKVYLDVYDAANSSWLTCPMGVYIIDLPTKRKVQLINATGYDQMQKLDEICDTWWNGLNWSGGITLSQLLTSLATQIGVSVSGNTASAIVNGSVSFTEEPFQCVEVTYREVLEYIAEATGTVARFDRNGALDLRWFAAAQISGNTVTVNTDTVGNQCLAISVAEYSVAAVDLLKVKLYTDDIGTTVGTGTNQYTIVNNLFLDGANSAAIIAKATPIYNRLHGLGAYSPVSARVIMDWSIEAGDIINIVNDSTTYSVPIFQQSMAWRGGYVVSDLLSDGDNVRPVLDYDERTYYRLNSEMSKKVGDDEIISKINQSPESITIQANKVNLTGYVTFTNLSTSGQTSINGGNITTGTIDASVVSVKNLNASNITSGSISANRISGGYLNIGGANNANGIIRINDAKNNIAGLINNVGVTTRHTEGVYSHTLQAGLIGSNLGLYDETTQNRTADISTVLLNNTDEYGEITLQGYSGGTLVSKAELYAHPNTNQARLKLTGGNNAVTLCADGTYVGDLTMIGGDLTVTGDVSADDVTVNGTLDVTPRRCYAELSSAGWYRVLKYVGGTSETNGRYGDIIDISISRSADSTQNEAHRITLLLVRGNIRFVDEVSDTNSQAIDQIRYTQGSDAAYIDIHYNTTAANSVYVGFDVNSRYQQAFTAESLRSVADSPSGETVLTTYEFTTDGIRTVTLTSAHSSVTINSQKAVRYGKVVSMTVSFTVSTSISGYGYLINTPTFATPANALVYDNASTVQTNVRLYASEGNTGLRSYGSFPAGSYVAFITYITTDA